MANEPEQRYPKDLPIRHDANASSDEELAIDRGQFWVVTDHIRSCWARRGAGFGLTFAALYPLLGGEVPLLRMGHLASTLIFMLACAMGGLVAGLLAVLVCRRLTGEA